MLPWRFCVWGPKSWFGVRSYWWRSWMMVRFLVYWVPKGLWNPEPPTTKTKKHFLCKTNQKPKERHPAQWRKQLLRMFGPDLIQSLWIQTTRNAVSKNCGKRGVFLVAPAAKFWKREIMSLSAKALSGFCGNLWLMNSSNKRCFGTQAFTPAWLPVSSSIVGSSSHALWHVLSNK